MNANQITKRNLPAPVFQRRGETYRVDSTSLELPRGSHFITLPTATQSGDLALFAIGNYLTIGRWISNVAGFDWIVQPGRLIPIVGKTPVSIVGAVVAVEMAIKQIAMPDAERFFDAPFPRRMDA